MRVATFIFASLFAVGFQYKLLADDWPQWMGPQRDGVWRETGILSDFSNGNPKVLWRTPVAGGYAGPAVSDGRVFLTDYVTEQQQEAPSPNVRNELQGTERVLCFEQMTGRRLWKYEYPRPYKISYPAGPRATPLIDADRVYTLGAEGDLACLRVADGEVIWSLNLADEYNTKSPIWGYAAHPVILGDKLICLAGGDGSAAVALNKNTGKEIWRALTTPDIGYAPPTIIQAGGTTQLLIWHSKSLNSLDPNTGGLFWSEELEPDYAMSIAPPLVSGDLLFVGAIKDKSMALRLDTNEPAAELLWRGKNGVGVGPSHCPVVVDPRHADYAYGVDRGGLRCIRLSTGEHVWETYELMASKRRSNAGNIFITPHEDRFFLYSETGELVIAHLSPDGYEEIGRTKPLLRPTHDAFGRDVVWSPPAFAGQSVFLRNDEELIRVSLKE